jgi:molybdenum cofactor cytidylyltransferase
VTSVAKIVPILLAAGDSGSLGFPKAIARFYGHSALQIAVDSCSSCAGLAPPIVVLGSDAAQVRSEVPPGVRVVVNRRWRSGQISSVLAGLRCVPSSAAFMLYPVDHPMLTRAVIRRLVRAFATRREGETIVVPRHQGRPGHPVIFAAELRSELQRARTAREVTYRDEQRVKYRNAGTAGIYLDFDSPKDYLHCLIKYGQARLREREIEDRDEL